MDKLGLLGPSHVVWTTLRWCVSLSVAGSTFAAQVAAVPPLVGGGAAGRFCQGIQEVGECAAQPVGWGGGRF